MTMQMNRRAFLVGTTVLAAYAALAQPAKAFMQIATPEDYIGVSDDQRVRAAIADASQSEIYLGSKLYQLYDPTPIPVRSGLTLRGPGKQSGRGVKMMTGNCPVLFDGGTGLTGFMMIGLDFTGANNSLYTNDALFRATNARQCGMVNCLSFGFTGTAWEIDGDDSNANYTAFNRIDGGTSAGPGSCAIALYSGNAMSSDTDYISGYQTLLRSRVSGLTVKNITMERAVVYRGNGPEYIGDMAYLEGGSVSFFGGWVDPSTAARTIVQTHAGTGQNAYIRGSWTRGVYPGNVAILDSSRFIWTYNLSKWRLPEWITRSFA